MTDGASNTLTCKTTPTVGPDCTVTNTSTNKFVTFTGLPPGNYQPVVTSNDGSFANLTSPPAIQLLPAASTARTATLTLTPLVSSMTGAVVDPNNTPIAGAKVQLWTWSPSAPATDFNGNTFATQTTGPDGIFNFGLIKNNNYKLVVDAPGYARVSSGLIPITYPTPVPAQTITATTPSTRNTTLSFTSPVSGASLTGATVTLTPVAGTSNRVPDNTTMSGIAVSGSGPWTANIPQLPTGTWKVTIVGQNGVPFPVPAITNLSTPSADTFVVPEDTDKGSPQPLSGPLKLNEATVTFPLGWATPIPLCATAPVSGSTIPLTVTKSSVSTTVQRLRQRSHHLQRHRDPAAGYLHLEHHAARNRSADGTGPRPT